MARILIALNVMLYSALAFCADTPPRLHVDQLLPLEQCVYKAKLGAAAAWLRIEKHATSCDTIKYIWRGDETEFEIAFIKEYSCEGFQMGKDPIKTGDIIFETCYKQLTK